MIALTLLVFIGCGGGSSGGSGGGTSPTNNPTSTSAPYSNDYKVLAAAKGTKASTGIIIVLPISANNPSGYSPAGGAYITFTNSKGVQVTTQADANGRFNAQKLGIPGISGSSDVNDISLVDISFDGEDETNIPIPVFDGEVPSDPGEVIAIKIVPGASMIKEGADHAFFCLGITSMGYVVKLKNITWSVSDESIIKIKETTDEDSVCVVQGVSGGAFPSVAFADLVANYNDGVLPTSTATIEPSETPEATETPETPESNKAVLTDTAMVGVIKVPEKDATVTGTLLDQSGQPVPNARLVFHSAQVAGGSKSDESFFMAYPAWTDAQGQFTAELMSGQTYTVKAMVGSGDDPEPTPTITILPTSEDQSKHKKSREHGPHNGYMNIYSTTPATFGPVVAGQTTQDFTLAGSIIPTPFPTHTWSPHPSPTMTWIPTPFPTNWTPFPFPTSTESPED